MDTRDDCSGAELLEEYLRRHLTCGVTVHHVGLPGLVEEAIAGMDALLSRYRTAERWLYLRVPMPRDDGGEFLRSKLAPLLLGLPGSGQILGWWWLYKHDACGPAVRLRIRLHDNARLDPEAIRTHCARELGCELVVLRYEPELRLFGGSAGMHLAHDQFANESRFLAEWSREHTSAVPTVPHALSLALVLATLRAGGLDTFECWDVLDRVREKRPAGPGHHALIASFRPFARRILDAGPDSVLSLYERRCGAPLGPYRRFLSTFGRDVSRAHFSGGLTCGLREFFVPIVLFHWNRIRMAALDQLALAHSLEAELEAMSRQGHVRLADAAMG